MGNDPLEFVTLTNENPAVFLAEILASLNIDWSDSAWDDLCALEDYCNETAKD